MNRLPLVKAELIDGFAVDFKSPDKLNQCITKLAVENPQIVMMVDALGKPGGLVVAAIVYAMLDSQREADQMDKDFT